MQNELGCAAAALANLPVQIHGGPAGERLWAIMLEIAEGKAWRPTWVENGIEHIGEPVIPSSADRLAAARELGHMLFGKPVPQTEASQAEADARELEAARALTDSELEARVRAALAPGRAIEPGPEVDAEIAVDKAPH